MQLARRDDLMLPLEAQRWVRQPRAVNAHNQQEVLIMPKHVAVWIDHREAHVFHINPDQIEEETLRVPQHLHRRHPPQSQGAKEHPDDAKRFFHEVVKLLEGVERSYRWTIDRETRPCALHPQAGAPA